MPSLFDPLRLGDLTLPNRVVMAPLTRTRSPGHVPNALVAEYYRQRASAGLIISEGIPVSPMGVGYADVPGLWSEEQVEGWKPVTHAVHGAGGRILAQIWHVGRISDPSFLGGRVPVAPSAIAAKGHVSLLRPQRPYVTPHALETEEVAAIVEQFRQAAANAQRAGFDGVELHGANGYLLDQFLQDSTNRRTDRYGGSIANRARLLLEATDAAISVFGPGRVGVHLAPRCDTHDMGDSDPVALFTHVAQALGERRIAFLCSREAQGPDSLGPQLKRAFGGAYIANEGFTRESAEAILDRGDADAVAFGKLFIANPDLPERFAHNLPLNTPDPSTFSAPGPHGYTDYPALAEAA